MHELSIARSILETVAAVAPLQPGERYTTVRLRVGEISGVEPAALGFGLEVLAGDRGWPTVDFEIERTPLRRRCVSCGEEFAVEGHETDCPQCGEPKTRLAGGDELELRSVDVEYDE